MKELERLARHAGSASGSRGDEICPFQLLEAPRNHVVCSTECGYLDDFERTFRELVSSPNDTLFPTRVKRKM
jgi:hypothetical protein